MERSTRKWRVLGAIGLLGAASMGVLTSSVSPAAGQATVRSLEVVGLLRLNLTASARTFSFTPAGATQATLKQSITPTTPPSKCGVTTSGPLVTVTAGGGTQGLGLVTNGLGVRQKNTCSSAEGRLSGDEEITVTLGSFFGSDVRIADAELDIEGKFNADVDVWLDGADPDVADPIDRSLVSSSSDNGPDSGVGDNDRVLLYDEDSDVDPFRSMTLRADGGEVSLEGGGDGSVAQYSAARKIGLIGASLVPATADTIFRLVAPHDFDAALFCGDTHPAVIDGTATSATSAQVKRLDNDGNPPQPCEDVGVTMEIRDDGVFLDKGTTGINSGDPQAANAVVDIVWAARAATMPVPPRQINFDPDNPDSQFVPVQWCLSWNPMTETAVHPANVPWCLVKTEALLQGDGTIIEVQRYHGDGDPKWR